MNKLNALTIQSVYKAYQEEHDCSCHDSTPARHFFIGIVSSSKMGHDPEESV
ncbi:hypothetical protein [Aneurinibacillus danicus]|uniref:Uncharacterized protein n=1 Tax=Aneurinibacillus danicus TaxID=267746 RepID=A0A511V1X1_9BACL|nr:hypothetical protein [Aneurinibacillus danicus]GEN32869.1 hypothetical protein ADA01nite_03290 [Aneurinibacillus danicus]